MVVVRITSNWLVMDGSVNSKMMLTEWGVMVELKREFISMRTNEALAQP